MSEAVDLENIPAAANDDDDNARGREGEERSAPETVPSGGGVLETSFTARDGDMFLGAEVCQSPVQKETAVTPPGYVPLAAVQERAAAAALSLNGGDNYTQEVPLDLPFAQITPEGSSSERTAVMERSLWRREDGSALPALASNGYVYNRSPARLLGRSGVQAPSIAGSGAGMKGGLLQQHQLGMGLDAGRSVPNASGSISSSHGAQRGALGRREDIYRLSQNPWGPNTVFGPWSIATDMESWQFPNGERSYDPECILPSDGTFPYDLLRSGGQPFSMYSKYQGRHGIFSRVRRKIAEVGGRLCHSFFAWVILVAVLAGMEGFREKSGSITTKDRRPDVDWSDSEADSENDSQQPRFNVHSFKG